MKMASEALKGRTMREIVAEQRAKQQAVILANVTPEARRLAEQRAARRAARHATMATRPDALC